MKRNRKVKFFRWLLALAGVSAVAGGLGATLSIAKRPETTAVASASKAAPSQTAAPAPVNHPTAYKAVAPDSNMRPYGSSIPAIAHMAPLAFKLNQQNRANELDDYSMEAIERKVRYVNSALGYTGVKSEPKIFSVVYNLVQMYDQSNKDNTVAWRGTNRLVDPNDKEYALIFFDGGPSGGPREYILDGMSRYYFARPFFFNQPQYNYYGRQYVGKFGASSQGNLLFDRLVSADKKKLQDYKDAYDRGELAEMALLWAIGGQLDLSTQEMSFAASMAYDIVAGARLKHMVQQLKDDGYARVGVLGMSFGNFAATEAMFMYPEVMAQLTGASVGEHTYERPRNPDYWNTVPINYGDELNAGYIALSYGTDTRVWFKKVLEGPYGAAFKEKLTVHNVANDEVFGSDPKIYEYEKNYWESVGVKYVLYPSGGHSYLFTQGEIVAKQCLDVDDGWFRKYTNEPLKTA